MQRSARPYRLALALVALGALASCSDSDPAGAGGGFRLEDGESLGEGIFAIDLDDRSIVQLAAIPGPDDRQNFVKFTFADRGDGFFDFAYVPEIEDGGLHHFEASVGRRGMRVGGKGAFSHNARLSDVRLHLKPPAKSRKARRTGRR